MFCFAMSIQINKYIFFFGYEDIYEYKNSIVVYNLSRIEYEKNIC
jgi:hypothetical protein